MFMFNYRKNSCHSTGLWLIHGEYHLKSGLKENSASKNIKMEMILNSFPLLSTVSAKTSIINVDFLSHISFRAL